MKKIKVLVSTGKMLEMTFINNKIINKQYNVIQKQ